MSYLEGNFVAHVVLLGRDLIHLLLDIFLRGSLHIDVITVTCCVMARDSLENTNTHTQVSLVSYCNWRSYLNSIKYSISLSKWILGNVPCGNPESDSCRSRG